MTGMHASGSQRLRACPSSSRRRSASDAGEMAGVKRVMRCDLAAFLAKGAAEQDFIDARSYRTITWGAEASPGYEGRHTFGLEEQRAP